MRAVHLLTLKEHHRQSLSALRALVTEAVCMVELYFPVSHMDIKLHNLVMLVDNVEFWGKLLPKQCLCIQKFASLYLVCAGQQVSQAVACVFTEPRSTDVHLHVPS